VLISLKRGNISGEKTGDYGMRRVEKIEVAGGV
jgi:hypothetical protein